MGATKNLCAQVPESLHAKVRQAQEQSGQTLSQYLTNLLTEYYENGGISKMDTNVRTVAFQIPETLFQQLKDYLKKNNLKQKDFILGLIQRELNDVQDEENVEN